MGLRLTVLELVVSDMAASLAFYRRLGLVFSPEADDEPHVEVDLGGGLRLALDTEDTIRSFDPSWAPRAPGGHRVALSFDCGSPQQVDATWADLTGAGYVGHLDYHLKFLYAKRANLGVSLYPRYSTVFSIS